MARRHRANLRRSTVSILLTSMALGGCGAQLPNSDKKHHGSDATPQGNELVKAPPRGYYDALVAMTMDQIDATTAPTSATAATPEVAPAPAATPVASMPAPTGAPVASAPAATPAASGPAGIAATKLWINFNGATVAKGYEVGSSFMLCQASTTIAPIAALTSTDKATIVAAVQGYFTSAKVDLDVTSTKPSAGSYTTVIVGGSIADLGCADHGEYGASPLDLGNANKNDIAFAFAKTGISDQQLAVNIAHVAGHTYGLETAADPADVMALSPSIDSTGFGKGLIAGSTVVQDEPSILQKAVAITPPATDSESILPPIIATIPGIDLVIAEIAKMNGDGTLGSLIPLIKALLPIGERINPKDISGVLTDNGIHPGSTVVNTANGNNNTIVNGNNSGNNVNVTINILNTNTNNTNQSSMFPVTTKGDSNSTSNSTSNSSSNSTGGSLGKESGCSWIFGIISQIKNLHKASGPSCNSTASATNGSGTSGTAPVTASVDPATPSADPSKAASAAAPVDPAAAPKIAALLNSVTPTLSLIDQNFDAGDQQSLGKVMKASCAHGYLSLVGNLE